MNLLQIERLTKCFGTTSVLRDLSFTVEVGKQVALWGPNGAGKTTLLRCILGLLPFKGTIRLDGYDVRQQGKTVRRLIGFVPQEVAFYPTLNVGETVAFFACLRGLDFRIARPILEQVGLADRIHQPTRTLSGGQRQRLALALALLGDPLLLLLDEPTASLDMHSRSEFLTYLESLKQQGKTLIFSTHRFEEIEQLAGRVLFLENGRLEADTTPALLKKRLFQAAQHACLRLQLPAVQHAKALQTLQAKGFDACINSHGLEVRVPRDRKALPLLLLDRAGFEIIDFELHA